MGADNNIDFTGDQLRDDFGLLGFSAVTRKHFNLDGKSPQPRIKVVVVLLR